MMWGLAGIRAPLAAAVAAGSVAVIWLTFEIGFDVEMYQGLLDRWFAGYRDF
jgi:hypothetical protein